MSSTANREASEPRPLLPDWYGARSGHSSGWLRSRHPSLLIVAGVPIKVISKRLGYGHPAFTMHTYHISCPA